MAFHVRDSEADALVRELARKRGVGITEAVKLAAREALQREADETPLVERIRAYREKVLSRPATGLDADKAFYDWLSDEEDE
jgi:antitoxin VapB